MMGAMLSKPILALGRRRSILISNAIITVFAIPFFFFEAVWILAGSRFIIAFCAALIVNASAVFIGESVPDVYKAYLGTTIQLGNVIGICTTNIVNLALPYWAADEPIPTEAYETNVWRISWALPVIPAIVSSLFWLFFFKNEPLKFLITKAESDGKDSKAYADALRVIGENYLL